MAKVKEKVIEKKDSKISKSIIEKAKINKCVYCYEYITGHEIDTLEFWYAMTSRKSLVFAHKKCWDEEAKARSHSW